MTISLHPKLKGELAETAFVLGRVEGVEPVTAAEFGGGQEWGAELCGVRMWSAHTPREAKPPAQVLTRG